MPGYQGSLEFDRPAPNKCDRMVKVAPLAVPEVGSAPPQGAPDGLLAGAALPGIGQPTN